MLAGLDSWGLLERDHGPALRELGDQTGWHCWQGVTGLLYARRPKSSPPKVARAKDMDALREAISAQQRASGASRN